MTTSERFREARVRFAQAASNIAKDPTSDEAWRELCRARATLRATLRAMLRAYAKKVGAR